MIVPVDLFRHGGDGGVLVVLVVEVVFLQQLLFV
jgi:hypothetical protein